MSEKMEEFACFVLVTGSNLKLTRDRNLFTSNFREYVRRPLIKSRFLVPFARIHSDCNVGSPINTHEENSILDPIKLLRGSNVEVTLMFHD